MDLGHAIKSTWYISSKPKREKIKKYIQLLKTGSLYNAIPGI